MSRSEELVNGLSAVSSSLDDALDALAAARQRAAEAVDYFAALGGSAGRAHVGILPSILPAGSRLTVWVTRDRPRL